MIGATVVSVVGLGVPAAGLPAIVGLLAAFVTYGRLMAIAPALSSRA